MALEEDVLGKAYDGRLMRRLLGYLRPHWRTVVVAIVAIVGHSALELVPPYLTRQVIDVHIPARDVDAVGTLAATYLAVLCGAFALEFLQTWAMQLTGQRIMYDLRLAIYGHLQRLDLRFYDRNPVGRLMTRVTSDVDTLNELFTSGVVAVFGDLFTLVGITAVMLALDWHIALVAFAVLPLVVVVTQWFRRNVRESYRTVRTRLARINAFLQEHISGMATVQLFGQEARSAREFAAIDGAHRDANVESVFYYAVFYPAIEFVGALATALIIWVGGGRALQDAVTLGTVVAFIQYSQRFFRPIADMSEKFNVLQSAMASSERIFGLLDTPIEIGQAGQARQAGQAGQALPTRVARRPAGEGDTRRRPRIAFEGVWFAYAGEDWVLRDVSFVVEPGQRVAIVGATGAGKTTVINLLLRFYDVSRGRITIDGVDIRHLDLATLRARFGLVLQDVHLFSGTIGDNVRLGTPRITRDDVAAALAAVHADGFVAALPGGIDAPVVERGATLSVGQKQLLSFARALAHDPDVLILDEATSSVDTATEVLIRDALHVLMAGRSTIAIAHRLSTIRDMDEILVLHKGQLRERGTHEALMAARGLYARLAELQYSSGTETPTT